jgi:putative tricarboxylic transport membrane protein
MSSLDLLAQGFAIALQPQNLLLCFIGVFWGTIVGVLPGLGPLAGLTLLLPLTFKLDAHGAIIMLSGIFYGAMYGGSTTSILMRIPGEAASIVTCLDGYAMARQGRAGPALVVAAIGSFIGASVSIVGLMLFAPPLAELMVRVGPIEELALLLLTFTIVSFVSQSTLPKTVLMIFCGLLIASVGLDPIEAVARYTFGVIELTDGISFVAIAIGLFGVSEILLTIERIATIEPIRPALRDLLPRWADLRASMPAIMRGTGIGFVFGLIPGPSGVLSTFTSYAIEKRLSGDPDSFGKGRIEGVAGPETANNATTGAAMIPLMVLGIPSIPATALLLSALIIHDVQPGTMMIQRHPEVFWGLIASMYLGNVMLLVLNLPLVGIFINLLRIPYAYLAALIVVFCVIGVYTLRSSTFDIMVMLGFGVIGYALRKFAYDVAPLLLAVVLGDRIESAFRQSLIITSGDYARLLASTFVQVIVGALVVILAVRLAIRALGYRKRDLPPPE